MKRLMLSAALPVALMVTFQCSAAPPRTEWNQMPACSWAKPGTSPFTGDKYAAVDAFSIPALDRDVIKRNMSKYQPTAVVTFTRDSIKDSTGQTYDPHFTPMFFGRNTLCWTPSRAKWKDEDKQHGDLFCSGRYCVAVPYICGNVTQVLMQDFDDGQQAPSGYVTPYRGNNLTMGAGITRAIHEPVVLPLAAVGIAAVAFMRKSKSKNVGNDDENS